MFEVENQTINKTMTNTLEKIYRIFDSSEPDEYGSMDYPRPNGVVEYHTSQLRIKEVGTVKAALERKIDRSIKPGPQALHTCDWTSCVNPNHLYEGTEKDNMRDRTLRQPESWDYCRGPNYPMRGFPPPKRAEVIK
jgi:hypothetical protein